MKIIEQVRKDFNLVEVFQGGSIALVFKVAGIALGYIFYYTITKLYNAEEFGVFSLAWTVLIIATIFGKLGLDSSIIKFVAGDSAHNNHHIKHIYSKGFRIVLFCSIASGVLLFAVSVPLSRLLFENAEQAYLIRWMAVTVVPFSFMSYNAEFIRGLKMIVRYSVFQNSSIYVITLLFVFVFYFFVSKAHFPIQSIAFATILLSVASFIVLASSIKKALPKGFSGDEKSYDYRKMIRVSLPMLLTNSLYLIMSYTDVLMLGAFSESEAVVGVYNLSVKIAALIPVVMVATDIIGTPKYAELHSQNDHQAFRKIAKQISLLNTLVSLPILLIIFIMPRFILNFFGSEYLAGVSALLILSVGQFINAFSGSKIHILNMTGHEKTGRNVLFAGTILNIILNYFMIPRYGINGAAIATMSSTVFWNVAAVFFIWKYFGFTTYPFNIKGKKA